MTPKQDSDAEKRRIAIFIDEGGKIELRESPTDFMGDRFITCEQQVHDVHPYVHSVLVKKIFKREILLIHMRGHDYSFPLYIREN